MDLIFKDEDKIKTFAKIQESLSNLETNSGNDEIDLVINQIPKTYLEQKDDLMVICSIFAFYSRNNHKTMQGNTIKLFEKIIIPIKKYLGDESSFLWSIFGSIYYLKFIMYEKGLISLDTIVQNAILDETFSVAQYFLPELFEFKPEIFDKEFKDKLQITISKKYINEFKELRKKHIKWLRESNDYKDPFYREIEQNQLRLAIKTDDVDQFQAILSNSNIPIDSKIQESLIENIYYHPHEISLIEFAIDFNAINIFKYLYLNGAKAKSQSIFNAICNRNYEIIHIIESMNKQKFQKNCLLYSIMCCNQEMVNYAIDNYNYDFLGNENVDQSLYESIILIIYHFCYSINFSFFDSIFLPFLKKNQKFLNENINEIIINSIEDYSCFFMKEFLKHPGVNVNYHSEINNDETMLDVAVKQRNYKAVEILLNDPKIDIESHSGNDLLPFHIACAYFADVKVLDMFIKNPKFDINKKDLGFPSAFSLAAVKGNFYAIEFIMKKFPYYDEKDVSQLIYYCFGQKFLMAMKMLLKFILKKNKEIDGQKIIESLANEFGSIHDEFYNTLQEYLLELNFLT